MTGSIDKPKSAYHHGDLRQALTAAARELIDLKGPDNFSVAEAARKAGVSSAAPYKHFADKDELMVSVCIAAMGDKYASMQAAIDPLPPRSPERLVALGRVYIDFAIREPNVFRMMFGLSASHDKFEPAVQKGKKTFGLVIEEVALMMGVEPTDPQAQQRAFMLWSFVHGLAFSFDRRQGLGDGAGP